VYGHVEAADGYALFVEKGMQIISLGKDILYLMKLDQRLRR
jgi:hypothetical protein